MAGRFRAWLRRKLKLSGRKQDRKTASKAPDLQNAPCGRQEASSQPSPILRSPPHTANRAAGVRWRRYPDEPDPTMAAVLPLFFGAII